MNSLETIIKSLVENEGLRRWAKNKIESDKGSREDVQDIFQMSIAILWRNLVRGDEIQNHEAYVKAVITKNWNQKSKQKRLRREKLKNIKFKISIDSVENEFISQEQNDMIQKELAKLDELCRNILRLFYFEGKSHQEISDQLAIGKNAVQIRQKSYFCRAKFRERLKQIPNFKDLF